MIRPLVACLLSIAAVAAAQARPTLPKDPPLPPPRPLLEAPPAPAPPRPEPEPKPKPEAAEACALVGAGEAVVEPAPDLAGDGLCAVTAPVRLKAIVLKNGRKVPLRPEAMLDCAMARAVTEWVREDLAPRFGSDGGQLSRLDIAGSLECRPRNRVPGAQISEHATGNALDLSGFETSDGKRYVVGKDNPQLFEEVKRTACARFETVLGPGSDSSHHDHLHLDLRMRRTRHMFCQWTLGASP